jgi:hypothetical protein
MRREYTIITNLLKLRTKPYSLAVEPVAQEFLLSLSALSEEALLKLSNRREPRAQRNLESSS